MEWVNYNGLTVDFTKDNGNKVYKMEMVDIEAKMAFK